MKPQISYLQRINKSFLLLLAAHVPVMAGVALYFGTGVRLALFLGLLFLAGPALLYFSSRGSKLTSISLAIASMCFSALLIHLSGGMIEMHFHIFTMLALTIAFRFPWPLVAAATAIAVHHVAFFLWLPHSIFNYDATLGIVCVHAFFVVFEVLPALWLTNLLNESALSSETTQLSLRTMADSVREVIRGIAGSVDVLSGMSGGLSTSSDSMTLNSRQASDKSGILARAAEQMSSDAESAAAGMDRATERLADVASATEEMTSTIAEIATNSEKARRVTGEASERTNHITDQMKELTRSVQEIGKITETITEISAQTNLLALNATIEAARAGSAGKGFSVVANEIKALAHQTSEATEDIKSRISGLRTSTAKGMKEIEEIAQVVREVSGIVSGITASIEEQAKVTRGIAGHIMEAATGVNEANQRVSRTSQVSGEITKDIAGVNQISAHMASSSEKLLTDAGEISRVAEQLREGISRFQSCYDSYDRQFA